MTVLFLVYTSGDGKQSRERFDLMSQIIIEGLISNEREEPMVDESEEKHQASNMTQETSIWLCRETTTIFQYDKTFSFLTTISILAKQFVLKAKLIKNNSIFHVESSEERKNLNRAFVKHSLDSEVKLLIDPEGMLIFSRHTFLSSSLVSTIKCSQFRKQMQVVYWQSMKKFKLAFQLILGFLQPKLNKQKRESICAVQERIQHLKNCSLLSNIKSYLFGYPLNKIDEEFQQDLSCHYFIQIQTLFNQSIKNLDRANEQLKFQRCVLEKRNFSEYSHLVSSFRILTVEKIVSGFENSLKIPVQNSKKLTQEPCHLSQIYIEHPQALQQENLSEGGFGIIKKAEISYWLLDSNKQKMHQKPLKNTLTIKTNKTESMQESFDKINREKLILAQLKTKKNKFLPFFYYSNQQQVKGNLFCEFYQHQSLQNWLSSYGFYSSMFTKLSLCLFICYGVKFLHENLIIHRDLKLTNILFDPKPSIKIIDFGEAYHPVLQKYFSKSINPGCSIPTSPPEAYIHTKNDQPSYDIFGIGVILFQILFETKIFQTQNKKEHKKMYIQAAEKFQQNGFLDILKKKLFYAQENIKNYGPEEILTPVLNIISQCLNVNPEKRPCLEWIIYILKETYHCFLQFYSF